MTRSAALIQCLGPLHGLELPEAKCVIALRQLQSMKHVRAGGWLRRDRGSGMTGFDPLFMQTTSALYMIRYKNGASSRGR